MRTINLSKDLLLFLVVIISLMLVSHSFAVVEGDLGNDYIVNIKEYNKTIAENWLNSGEPNCPGDLDGNCFVDFNDLQIFLSTWLTPIYGCRSIMATSSSTYDWDTEWTAYMAIDEDFGTRWRNRMDQGTSNRVFVLDFNQERDFSGVTIYWHETEYPAGSYDIEISNDRITWTTFTDSSGDGGTDVIDLGPQTARFLRIKVPYEPSNLVNASIYEVEVDFDDSCLPDEPPASWADLNWKLVWEDNFDSFDSTRWEMMSHTWGENMAQFDPANIEFSGGTMKLWLTYGNPGPKLYTGAEYRVKKTEEVAYGRFLVRMRSAASVTGTVSSFFTYRDPPNPWGEIDIEFVGKDPNIAQYNPWWGGWPNCFPVQLPLGFNSSADFHIYGIEWTPNYITWTVDGTIVHSVDINITSVAQQLMMNIWVSEFTDWVGPWPDVSDLPVCAEYDWVKYYEMNFNPIE